jgi:hypothetical protein
MLETDVGLSVDMAEQYLRRFRNMSLYFPFAIIPASTSIEKLALEKPTLCVAVLTASSVQDKPLQAKLEEKLRMTLIEKIMVKSDKTLELFGAVLVYLGWAHFHHIPNRGSMMQFAVLAVSICEELGLGLTPEEAANRHIRHQLDHGFSAEARRLYLGMCFLANS